MHTVSSPRSTGSAPISVVLPPLPPSPQNIDATEVSTTLGASSEVISGSEISVPANVPSPTDAVDLATFLTDMSNSKESENSKLQRNSVAKRESFRNPQIHVQQQQKLHQKHLQRQQQFQQQNKQINESQNQNEENSQNFHSKIKRSKTISSSKPFPRKNCDSSPNRQLIPQRIPSRLQPPKTNAKTLEQKHGDQPGVTNVSEKNARASDDINNLINNIEDIVNGIVPADDFIPAEISVETGVEDFNGLKSRLKRSHSVPPQKTGTYPQKNREKQLQEVQEKVLKKSGSELHKLFASPRSNVKSESGKENMSANV